VHAVIVGAAMAIKARETRLLQEKVKLTFEIPPQRAVRGVRYAASRLFLIPTHQHQKTGGRLLQEKVSQMVSEG